jgi:hypothetical protein
MQGMWKKQNEMATTLKYEIQDMVSLISFEV